MTEFARRDLIAAALCFTGLGAAEWFRPRRLVRLLPVGQTLATMIPSRFGKWGVEENDNVVMPPAEGSLADQLYDELLVRSYSDSEELPPVVLLATYGVNQSDGLQLHRPESCYPAVGFAIVGRILQQLTIAPGISIPVVWLTAKLADRTEDIVYWTRLGNDLPQSAAEQREARLKAAIAGYTGDGVLVRASVVRTVVGPQHARVAEMLRDAILAVKPSLRSALVGSGIGDRLLKS